MFIEPGHSVIDPTPSAHALLSQNVREQLEDLCPADGSVLEPADDHLDMFHDRLRPGCVRRLGRRVIGLDRWLGGPPRGHRGLAAASGGTALVQVPFLAPPFLGPVVGSAACAGLTPGVGFTATEGTAQILAFAARPVLATGIARIREKEDPAVPTADQAPTPLRLPSQYRSQDLIVLQDQMPDFRAAVPVPSKPKMRRDRY